MTSPFTRLCTSASKHFSWGRAAIRQGNFRQMPRKIFPLISLEDSRTSVASLHVCVFSAFSCIFSNRFAQTTHYISAWNVLISAFQFDLLLFSIYSSWCIDLFTLLFQDYNIEPNITFVISSNVFSKIFAALGFAHFRHMYKLHTVYLDQMPRGLKS